MADGEQRSRRRRAAAAFCHRPPGPRQSHCGRGITTHPSALIRRFSGGAWTASSDRLNGHSGVRPWGARHCHLPCPHDWPGAGACRGADGEPRHACATICGLIPLASSPPGASRPLTDAHWRPATAPRWPARPSPAVPPVRAAGPCVAPAAARLRRAAPRPPGAHGEQAAGAAGSFGRAAAIPASRTGERGVGVLAAAASSPCAAPRRHHVPPGIHTRLHTVSVYLHTCAGATLCRSTASASSASAVSLAGMHGSSGSANRRRQRLPARGLPCSFAHACTAPAGSSAQQAVPQLSTAQFECEFEFQQVAATMSMMRRSSLSRSCR